MVLGCELLMGAGHWVWVTNQARVKLLIEIITIGFELLASSGWIRARGCWVVSWVARFEFASVESWAAMMFKAGQRWITVVKRHGIWVCNVEQMRLWAWVFPKCLPLCYTKCKSLASGKFKLKWNNFGLVFSAKMKFRFPPRFNFFVLIIMLVFIFSFS